MSMKIQSVRMLPIHSKKKNGTLFKHDTPHVPVGEVTGSAIFKDYRVSVLNRIILGVLDKISPMLNTHPKFQAKMLAISERFIRNSEHFE